MGLQITLPDRPSFVEDDIIIEVTTTTTNVEAHYIVLNVNVPGNTYSIKHPVISGKAIFNIKDIVKDERIKLFDLNADLLIQSQLHIYWIVNAYEIYNYDNTPQNQTGNYSGVSFNGKKGIYSLSRFLTNFRHKIIDRNDFVLLYFFSDYTGEGGTNLVISFNDTNNTVVEYNTQINSTAQILIKPDIIPEDATSMDMQIEGLSETITFGIKNFNIIDKRTILYRNSFGAYDTLTLYAHYNESANYDYKTFNSYNHTYKYNISKYHKIEKATFITEQFEDIKQVIAILDEIFTSEEVYLIDENYEAHPILILDKERDIVNSLDNKYQFKLTYQIQENA